MGVDFPYSRDYQPPAPVVDVTIRWRDRSTNTVALLDSGADASMFPIDLLREIHAEFVESRLVRGISDIASMAELYLVALQIGPYEISGVRAIAIRHYGEAIIGRDVLNHFVAILDGPGGVVDIS